MSKWLTAPLAKLGVITTGSTPPTAERSNYGSDVPFVTPAELGSSQEIVSTPRMLSKLGAQKGRILPAGSVLVCCIGSLGKIGISGCELVTNQQINAVTFDEQLVWPRYGFYACARLKQKLETMAPATTVAIVSKSKFAELEIPLPPLDEQKRIAAILDQADNLRRLRQRAIDRLNDLGQAIFYEMFGDVAHNARNLPVAPLASLVDKERPVTYGILKPGPNLEAGTPYIRVVDIVGGKVLIGQLRRTSQAIAKEYKRSTIREGDLLISIRGHVGRMAIAPRECEGANITQDTARLAISGANTHFIQAQLESPFARGWMKQRVRGIAVQGINLGDLRELPVVLPPRSEQDLFARRLEAVNAQLGSQIKQHSVIITLFSALQHRAFTGQL